MLQKIRPRFISRLVYRLIVQTRLVQMRLALIRLALMCVALTNLTGCFPASSNHPLVPSQQSATSIAAGAGTGALVGSLTSTNPAALASGVLIGGTNSLAALESRLVANGAQMISLGDTTTILIPADVYFAPKQDNFKNDVFDDDHCLLNLVTLYLNQTGNSVVKIAVSTDDVGNAKRNYILSYHQAYRIAAYLYQQGISAWRLYPMAYGDANLLATDRTSLSSADNRRIMIVVNPHVTPADCCGKIQHFMAEKQPWQYWGLPY